MKLFREDFSVAIVRTEFKWNRAIYYRSSAIRFCEFRVFCYNKTIVLRFLRAPWRVLENFHCQKECASNADRICRKREKYCEACEYIGANKLELEFFSLPLCLISYKFKASNFCSPFFKGLSSPDNLSLGSGVKCVWFIQGSRFIME